MSKQDIEKRLGFAAQGVKETTRTSAKAKFVRFMDLETWKNSKGTVFTAGIEDDAGRFQPYVTARDSSGGDQLQTRSAPTFKTEQGARKWLNTWMQNNKSTSSRPGAKAKMGSSQVNDSATTADLIREAQRLRDVIKTSNREFDKTHLRQIKQELDKRGVLMPYGASEVLAARPGVKAKFEDGGTRGAQALAFIKSKIAAGRTVAITTATRSTQITPKTYAKWEESGTPLFKLTSGGDLKMYEGGSYVFVTQGTTPLAKISSFARPAAKAKA